MPQLNGELTASFTFSNALNAEEYKIKRDQGNASVCVCVRAFLEKIYCINVYFLLQEGVGHCSTFVLTRWSKMLKMLISYHTLAK